MGTSRAKKMRREMRKFTKENYAMLRGAMNKESFRNRLKIAWRIIFKIL